MLRGKRIVLRTLNKTDASFMLDLLNDQSISKLEGKNELLVNEIQQHNWLESNLLSKDRLSLIICDAKSKEDVGYISFKYTNKISNCGHVGIKISNKFQGKGYGTDALKTFMSYLFFSINLHRLQSHIIDFNKGSLKLFVEKCGWKKEGVARKSVYIDGTYNDNIMIGILKEDYIKFENDSFYNKLLND